jgi:Fe2+ transport system protein B
MAKKYTKEDQTKTIAEIKARAENYGAGDTLMEEAENNGKFIANAPQDITYLLDILEQKDNRPFFEKFNSNPENYQSIIDEHWKVEIASLQATIAEKDAELKAADMFIKGNEMKIDNQRQEINRLRKRAKAKSEEHKNSEEAKDKEIAEILKQYISRETAYAEQVAELCSQLQASKKTSLVLTSLVLNMCTDFEQACSVAKRMTIDELRPFVLEALKLARQVGLCKSISRLKQAKKPITKPQEDKQEDKE